jgi:hypothetical protein
MPFVLDGQTRDVDMCAPLPTRRGGLWVVSLADLWVASLFPGDLVDLAFGFTVLDPRRHGVRTLPPLDALLFAKGHLTIGTRELWWDDPSDVPPAYRMFPVERINVFTHGAREIASGAPGTTGTTGTPRLGLRVFR